MSNFDAGFYKGGRLNVFPITCSWLISLGSNGRISNIILYWLVFGDRNGRIIFHLTNEWEYIVSPLQTIMDKNVFSLQDNKGSRVSTYGKLID